jgi:hypothetical protein
MSENSNQKTKFNNGDKPLVMAWIGYDEPNRGDTKSTIGLAKICADMLDGDYIYVDKKMLEEAFCAVQLLKAKKSFGDFNKAREMVFDLHGYPDLLLGTGSIMIENPKKPILLVETDISEVISSKSSCGKVVAHDLTQDELNIEAQKLHDHFPVIKGPLLAVMMGGGPLCEATAEKLLAAAEQYKEITLFLCPSRRTGDAFKELKHFFDVKTENKPHIHIVGVDYKDMLAGYNPYKGLLGAADHIAVVGNSYSLISEALFVGKTIYADNSHSEYKRLIWRGHIKPIHKLAAMPLPTVEKKPIDVTKKIASKLVHEFTARAELKAWKEEGHGPVSTAIKESVHWLKSLGVRL